MVKTDWAEQLFQNRGRNRLISLRRNLFARSSVNTPTKVTLITIGPLTNIATALNGDAELAGIVKSLVMMGGSLSGGNITPAAEFNIYVDPEAARIVFQSGIPITMVGLDVTRKTALTEDYVRQLEAGQNPVSRAAAKIARNAIAHNRQHICTTRLLWRHFLIHRS